MVHFPEATYARLCVLSAVLCLLTCAGCGPPPPRTPAEVVVPIAPLGWLVGQVAGPDLRVSVLVAPGQSAETWQVLPRQMEDLGRAKLYCYLGLPFEVPLVDRLKSMFPKLLIVDLRLGLKLRAGERHDDEGGAAHAHGAADPHIWLDPMIMKTLAGTVESALSTVMPDRAGLFAANGRNVSAELDALNSRLAQTLAPVKGREFFVFHPAFGYLADRYGLRQTAVEHEGKSPGARRLEELARQIKKEGARAIFVQPQYPTAEASALAESAGLPLVMLDDLAADYPDNLLRIGQALAEHLK